MANKERGELDVAIDGKMYTLKLTTNAACLLEAETGKSLDEVMSDMTKRGSLSMSRAFFWAALQDKHAKEFDTFEKVGKWIDTAGGLQKLSKKMTELIALNSEEAPKSDPQNPDPAAVGTGGNLSSTPVE